MKILRIGIFFEAILCTILRDPSKEDLLPGDKNLDIVIPNRITDPVIIRTKNIVRKTHSEYYPLKVYSATGEVIKSKRKNWGKSKLPEKIPFVRKIKKNPPNHKYFRNYKLRPSYYDPNKRELRSFVNDSTQQTKESQTLSKNSTPAKKDKNLNFRILAELDESTAEESPEMTGQLADEGQTEEEGSPTLDQSELDTVVKEPLEVLNIDPNQISQAALNAQDTRDSLQSVFVSTNEYEYEHSVADRIRSDHLCVAYNHLKNLEDQIRDAVEEAEAPDSQLMSPKVRKLLANFIRHIDFLEDSLLTESLGSPPLLYDYFLDREISLDTLLELREQNSAAASLDEGAYAEINASGKARLPGEEDYEQPPDLRFRRTLNSNPQRAGQTQAVPFYASQNLVKRNRALPDQIGSDQLNSLLIPQDNSQSVLISLPKEMHSSHVSEFLVVVESIKSFYNSLFGLIPAQINFSDRSDSSLKMALDTYHQLQLFSQTFKNGTAIFDKDLIVLRERMQAIAFDGNSCLKFYGYDSDYVALSNAFESANEKQVANNFKDSIDAQTRLFLTRAGNIVILVDEIQSDFSRMQNLTNDLSLPAENESLFSQDFIETLNYSNMRLPVILDMKMIVERHLKDLGEELQLVKDWQKDFDKIFILAHSNSKSIQEKSAESYKMSLVLMILFLMLNK